MSDEDNRKRGYQQEDEIGAALSSKRAALGLVQQAPLHNDMIHHTNEEQLYFKLLCPQSIVGIIIGKGGANMSHLLAITGAKIKLSQNGDFFPGTGDRVILLNGGRENLSSALRELVTKIAEANEKKGEAPQDRRHVPANRGPDGSFQIRLLIPHSSAGVLIGKGGAIIKQMIDKTQCKMQMGEEADPFQTNERMFVLNAASTHALASGAVEAMTVLHSQPKHRNYVNTTASYAPAPPSSAPGPSASAGAGQSRPPAPMPAMHPHHTHLGAPAPVPTTPGIMGPGGMQMMPMPMPAPGYLAPYPTAQSAQAQAMMGPGPRSAMTGGPQVSQGGHHAVPQGYAAAPAPAPAPQPTGPGQVPGPAQMSMAPQYGYPGQTTTMPQSQMQQGYGAVHMMLAPQQAAYARPGAYPGYAVPGGTMPPTAAGGMTAGQAVTMASGMAPGMASGMAPGLAPGMVMYAGYPAANGGMPYAVPQYPAQQQQQQQQQQYAAQGYPTQQVVAGGQYPAGYPGYPQAQMTPHMTPEQVQQMQQQAGTAAAMGQPYMAQGYAMQQQPQQQQLQHQQQYAPQYGQYAQYKPSGGR